MHSAGHQAPHSACPEGLPALVAALWPGITYSRGLPGCGAGWGLTPACVGNRRRAVCPQRRL